jgi:Predicted Zn-dependent hydrolases of the beta-lactamase fold
MWRTKLFIITPSGINEDGEGMKNTCIKIRWITTVCFEIVLPNGKVILIDPWTGFSQTHPTLDMKTGFEVDDFTGADYIFLSHTHFDHIDDARAVCDKFKQDTYGGRIFVPALSSYVFAQQYDIPYREIIPMLPNESFDLDDIVVDVLRCRHFGDKSIPTGPRPSRSMDKGIDVPQYHFMSAMGSIEEVDLAITVKENNFRILILGGKIYKFNNIYKFCESYCPSLVIRQASPGFTPKDYAEILAKYNTPLVIPSHHDLHDVRKASGKTFEEYFGEVNEELQALRSQTYVKYLEPLKWYNIGLFCDEV